MAQLIENWKTQVRKGYLELCILLIIRQNKRIYGFDLIEKLSALSLPVKEGTLYPLLNRMMIDKTLKSEWELEAAKGHPRKFYSLTKDGQKLLTEMTEEFGRMTNIYESIQNENK